jgi:hypothetical protein
MELAFDEGSGGAIVCLPSKSSTSTIGAERQSI